MATKQRDQTKTLDQQFKDWFVEYGSYVVLHRAVPHIEDGLKPSQRRVLHSLRELEDGRYNKVANVVGNTLKYHPHGDASVTETLVGVAQKDLLVDRQGNWGNILTGDGAAAGRYIEARLTPLAKEILFNDEITQWVKSYDGRNDEPVTLPVKFPLLIAQGTEGIAVSLSCKVLPHNFNEICDAAIAYLRKKPFKLLPDFAQGGVMDASEYNDGKSGGKVKVRAVIVPHSKHSLEIREIPFGTTTIALRDSILDAEAKGKIKIRKVSDMTAEEASIIVEFAAGFEMDKAIAALYAFTECEVTHYVNAVVIQEGNPEFTGISELLKHSVTRTRERIQSELELLLKKLDAKWMKLNLEKLFIQTKAYREVEDVESPEIAVKKIRKKLKPHWGILRREPTDEEILSLTELKIRRISKYDSEAAQREIEALERLEKETKEKLENLTATVVSYFKSLKEKYGKERQRRTEVSPQPFESSKEMTDILPADRKVYWNRGEGFIGTSLKREEELPFTIGEKTDIAAIGTEGVLRFNRPGAKTFYGVGLLSAVPVNRESVEKIYNIIYYGPASKNRTMAKRFILKGGFIRDKEYLLCGKQKGTIVYICEQDPKKKAPKVNVKLKAGSGARKRELSFDFKTLEVKNREALGNIVANYPAASAVEV